MSDTASITNLEPSIPRLDPGPANEVAVRPDESPSRALFWMLIGFFVLEYLRPPGIVLLRLQMVIILAVPVLWLASGSRPWSRNMSLQMAFLALSAAGAPFAYNYFAVYVVTRVLFGNVMIALAITWVLADRRNFERAAWIWVGIICYQAMYAITHGGRGTGGFLGDENDLALACNTAIPFAIAGVFELRGRARIACVAVTVLLVAAVVASFSRGGFIGLAALFAYLTLLRGERLRSRVRNVAIAAVALVAFYVLLPADYKAEMNTISDTREATAEARFFLWISAFNMWTQHPVFGVGAGNSSFLVGVHQPEPTEGGWFSSPGYTQRDWSMTAIHSMYFELLAERGLIGVLLVVWIVFEHFRTLRRLSRDVGKDPSAEPELRRDVALYSNALGGAMVGLLASGAFLSVGTYPYLWYLGAFAVALDRAARRSLPPPAQSSASDVRAS